MTSETYEEYFCLDCGVDTQKIHERYMIKDKIWLSAVPDGEGVLCIGCLEARIGRLLARDDFTKAHLNKSKDNAMSDRLLSRLTAT